VSADALVHRSRPAAGRPQGALVVCHGRGADEYDLEPLLDALDPERRLVGFLPRGPLSLSPGGAHWYVVREVGFPDPGTFLPTFERLSGWVDAVVGEAGVPMSRVVFAGFSQGAVMSYSLALAAGRPRPGGVLAFSGFVPTVEGFELDLPPRAGLPVSIAHGTHDPIITVSFGREAHALLGAAGLDVSYVEEPIGHTIGSAGLAQARTTLERALGLVDADD
jgi:phospholipase/carboxylesterase